MSVKFKIADSQLQVFKEKIALHKNRKGPLMPVLHEAQHLFGCIPIEVQKIIAEELEESIAHINGVVTFYSHFTIKPKGKHVIGICTGTACYVRGAQNIVDAISKELKISSGQTTMDGLFSLDTNRCIGACGLAPVLMIGEEVYGNATPQMALDVVKRIKEKVSSNEII